MEIRDYLGIGKKEKLLLSLGSATSESVIISIAKAPGDVESRPCSRNGAYILRKGVKK